MKIKSIFFSISLLFFISILSITISFVLFLEFDKMNYYEKLREKYMADLPHIIERNLRKEREKEFSKFNRVDIPLKPPHFFDDFDSKNFDYLKKIESINEKAKVLAYSKVLKSIDLKRIRILLVTYKESFYIYAKDEHFLNILLKDTLTKPYSIKPALWFFLFIILIFTTSYIFIIKKIYPLKRLKRNIDRFADGDFDIDININSSDEIGDVARAFQRAVGKIDTLIKSRQLFLRNIMHELKTPITKGMFAIELLENREKRILHSVFNRMENLIKESSSIERITSGELNLEAKEYRVIDILDEAIDLSMQERDIIDFELKSSPKKIKADFNYLAIAFKNLIDNAIKYSINKRVKIELYENKISFFNLQKELKHELKYYLEAFNKEKSQGLGLGLYITDAILKQHSFKLNYRYENEYNIFEIIFI